MSCRQSLEASQVVREPPEELVVLTDRSILTHSDDDGEYHIYVSCPIGGLDGDLCCYMGIGLIAYELKVLIGEVLQLTDLWVELHLR